MSLRASRRGAEDVYLAYCATNNIVSAQSPDPVDINPSRTPSHHAPSPVQSNNTSLYLAPVFARSRIATTNSSTRVGIAYGRNDFIFATTSEAVPSFTGHSNILGIPSPESGWRFIVSPNPRAREGGRMLMTDIRLLGAAIFLGMWGCGCLIYRCSIISQRDGCLLGL